MGGKEVECVDKEGLDIDIFTPQHKVIRLDVWRRCIVTGRNGKPIRVVFGGYRICV